MKTRGCAFTGPVAKPAARRSALMIVTGVLFTVWSLHPLSLMAGEIKPTLVIYVDQLAGKNGKGTESDPFQNLTEALHDARGEVSSHGKIYIFVRPGNYLAEETLRVDFPVEIRGSNVPEKDPDKWPTGNTYANSETLVYAQQQCTDPLLAVGSADGKIVSNVTIAGLSLVGCGLLQTVLQVQHTQKVVIIDNIVTGPASSGIDVAASSGLIARNYAAGMDACGICVGAGTDASPTQLTIADNRSEDNNGGGLLVTGTVFPVVENGNSLDVNILHNDLSGNDLNTGLGFGLRILAIGPNVPLPQTKGQVTARVFENLISDNQNNVMIDAGFPARNLGPGEACADKRTFTADFDLAFRGNTISGGLLRTSLISFTRGQVTTVGNAKNSTLRWQYLHGANFVIDDPDGSLLPSVTVKEHPLADPFVGGACLPQDNNHESLMNTLVYNGAEIAASP